MFDPTNYTSAPSPPPRSIPPIKPLTLEKAPRCGNHRVHESQSRSFLFQGSWGGAAGNFVAPCGLLNFHAHKVSSLSCDPFLKHHPQRGGTNNTMSCCSFFRKLIDAGRVYKLFPPIVMPRYLICVRNRRTPCLPNSYLWEIPTSSFLADRGSRKSLTALSRVLLFWSHYFTSILVSSRYVQQKQHVFNCLPTFSQR